MLDAASPSAALATIPRRDSPISSFRCDRIPELAQALARTRPDADDIATTST
jgi:hypothetical protein